MTDNFHFNKIEPAIGELVIANPTKRNALNSDMWAALPGLLAKIKTDRRLKVLILRGQGEHFAAGADISEFKTLYATPESSAHISDANPDNSDDTRGLYRWGVRLVPVL